VAPALALVLAALGVVTAGPASAAPPVNDTFSNATIVTMPTDSVTVGASNVDATLEAGESSCCFTGKTVWFKHTAADGRRLTLATTGGFDTYLAVYAPTVPGSPTVATLAHVVSNNDVSPGDTRSSVSFQPTAGVAYYVQLGSANGITQGTTSLVFAKAAVPPPPALAATTTKLTAPRKVTAGKKARITVAVSTSDGQPVNGTVTVAVSGKPTALALVNGTATMRTKKLRKPGKVTVSAAYAATSTTLASSATAKITVKKPRRT
jgi:hypothetical protein